MEQDTPVAVKTNTYCPQTYYKQQSFQAVQSICHSVTVLKVRRRRRPLKRTKHREAVIQETSCHDQSTYDSKYNQPIQVKQHIAPSHVSAPKKEEEKKKRFCPIFSTIRRDQMAKLRCPCKRINRAFLNLFRTDQACHKLKEHFGEKHSNQSKYAFYFEQKG